MIWSLPSGYRTLAFAVSALITSGSELGCRDKPQGSPEVASSAAAPIQPSRVVLGSYSAMGTRVDLRVWTDRSDGAVHAAMDDAHAEIVRLEAMMTTWNDRSELAKINANAGGAAVTVSQELVDLLARSKAIHHTSFGVFDVTFYALKGLWKFDQDAESVIPTDAAIAERLPLIDASKIEITGLNIRLPTKGMAINLGGIAKGYAVDKMAAVLQKHGFTNMVVQAGGDLLVRGRKGQAPWRVGIRDPRGAADDFFAIAPITDASFSTAGDYERGFVKDGVRYHHILDPRTGKPARACRSVTILAKDALTADELDDAVFILGPEKGLPLIEAREGVGAVIVDQDNHVIVSKRLQGLVEIVHPPTPGI